MISEAPLSPSSPLALRRTRPLTTTCAVPPVRYPRGCAIWRVGAASPRTDMCITVLPRSSRSIWSCCCDGRRVVGACHPSTRDLQQASGSVRYGQINEFAAGKGKAAAAGRLEPSKYLLGPLDLRLGRGENLMEDVQLARMDRRLTEKAQRPGELGLVAKSGWCHRAAERHCRWAVRSRPRATPAPDVTARRGFAGSRRRC